MGAYLSELCKTTRVENSAVAGTSDLTTDILDMQGFDGVRFVALLGDVTSGSALRMRVWQNSANSTSGATELACTASFTAGASDADNKLLACDVLRPTERYVYAVLERDTQNAVVDGIIADQYRARAAAVSTTGILSLAQALSPASV